MKKSIIYSVSGDILQSYIKESKTYGQVLKRFGLENRGSNSLTLKRRIKNENLDDSTIIKGMRFGGGWNKGTQGVLSKKLTKEEALSIIFVRNYTGGRKVRKYLRQYALIEEKCGECGLSKEWNKKPLVLEIDHIDGDSHNNELTNLRWLCGNCHSQTKTFRGRNKRKSMKG